MQKKFISTLLLLLFLNFLVKPFWIFGIDLTVQNRVGTAEYGLYFALFNFSLIFNILLDLGLTHYNNQAVAKNRVEVVRNFSNLTSLKFILGIVYLAVTVIAGFLAGYESLSFYLLTILTINQFLASLVLFFRSNLSGLQFFRADSYLSVLDKTLMVLLCAVLLYTPLLRGDFTVFHFAFAQTASYLLTVAIAFWMVLKKVRVFRLRLNVKAYRSGLLKSFPYALLILLMAIYTRVDGIMLERLVNSHESGLYAAAFRQLDMVNQISYLFGVLLLPMFSGMIGKREDVSRLTLLAFNILYVFLLAVALVAVFNAGSILHLLYPGLRGGDFHTVHIIFKILMMTSIAFGTTFIFGTLLTAAADLRILNYIALSGFLLNLVLNFILIPLYGAEGAAATTLFTQFATALAQVYYAFKRRNLQFPRLYGLRFLFFSLLAIGAAFGVQRLETGVVIYSVLFLPVLIFLAVSFGLFPVKRVLELIKNRLP